MRVFKEIRREVRSPGDGGGSEIPGVSTEKRTLEVLFQEQHF